MLDADSGERLGRFSDQPWVTGPPESLGLPGTDRYLLPVDAQVQPGAFSVFTLADQAFSLQQLPVVFGFVSIAGNHILGTIRESDGLRAAYVDIASNKVLWSVPMGAKTQFRIASDDSIYLENGAVVRKLDSATGENIWEQDYSTMYSEAVRPQVRFNTAIYAPDTVHLTGYDKTILASTVDGRVLNVWERFPFLRGCVAGDLLLGLGESAEKVSAFDKYTLDVLWHTEKPARYYSVRAAGNAIYAIDGKGNVYCYRWSEPYVSHHALSAPAS